MRRQGRDREWTSSEHIIEEMRVLWYAYVDVALTQLHHHSKISIFLCDRKR